MPPDPSPVSDTNIPARPDVLVWVEREPGGEYARYAADLCSAWRETAGVRVWMEPGDPCATKALFGNTPVETPERFATSSSAPLHRALRARPPRALILVGTRAAALGVTLARKTGIPATAYAALSDRMYADTSLVHVARNYLTQSRIIRSVHTVIVPTHGMRYQFLLRDWAPGTHHQLLPLCLPAAPAEASAARDALRRTLGVRAGESHVVYAGPFTKHARLDWLLRSWALVEEQDATARLTLAGEGPEGDALRALAERLGLARCTLATPEHPLPFYVAAADVVAMTCLFAIHARLPTWAMQAARPIVAMEADGVRMYVGHGQNGCLAPVGDIHAFSRALLELLRDPERAARLGAEGARRATQYAPDAHRDRAHAILTALLAGDAPT
jgi:glycosyltransferase involved in cell wall biosynthesis